MTMENEEILETKNVESNQIISMVTEIIERSTEKTAETMHSKNLLNNVAIFIDYDNVYWTLKKYYDHDPDHEDPEKNLFHKLWKRYGQDHVRTFRVYADFQKIRTSLTNLQKKRVQIRHVYSNGKEGENRKNSSDIELCIDAIESTYKDPSITCYVFVTADSDMIPILSRMMYKGKRVELFYLSKAAPKYTNMSNYVHYCEDLIKFINVEEKSYDVDQYLVPSMKVIKKWEELYGDTNKFLGANWLKSELSRELSIPEVFASELIEKLQIEKYVEDKTKVLENGQIKTSITLSPKGAKLVSTAEAEVAVSTEK